ncbi:hypothetical protein CPB84DRAFT_1434283 [Gymnopilus junonius]|uniref:F-box domain-containing protein n=1 Tax=Gymnopilus junonius TaxID=109634 RepID=A0A9P5NX00_GYMJU|nr:hypothetical protein CPB84DRAFT_1434283 [Gymnopilus junonius]
MRRQRRRGKTGIHELLVELLIMIFFLTNIIEGDKEDNRLDTVIFTLFQGSVTSPMTLIRVCRLWRKIAVDLPALWSSIYITQPAVNKDLALGQLWMRFSRKEPLYLT